MKRIFSGIKPSGDLHIGNYLGAIKQWVENQYNQQSILCVVDMHAITVPQDPKELQKRTLDIFAFYIACGIDPNNSIIFVQSHNKNHAHLSWILNCFVGVGHLERMTQYKDKKQKFKDSFIPAGLLNYPVLMAADILLYNADEVPVGEDQKQHIELTRDIAQRINSKYGNIFKIPEFVTMNTTTRIMSLTDPTIKMSKSDENPNGCLYLLDKKDDIVKKIKSATTDSYKNIEYNDERIAIKNLLNIYSAFSNIDIKNIVKMYENKGYKEFKEDLAQIIIDKLIPIQNKYYDLINNKDYLYKIMKEGAQKSIEISSEVLSKVEEKIGFIKI